MSFKWAIPPLLSGEVFVSRTLTLRSGLWEPFWYLIMSEFAQWYHWEQQDIADPTPEETQAEINAAIDAMVKSEGIVIGSVYFVAFITPPAWTLLCDGSEHAKADYPLLYDALDAAYIIDADHFQVPDLVGSFVRGDDTPASSGGEDTHTLTVLEMPSHDHSYNEPDSTVIAGYLGDTPSDIPWHSGSTTGTRGGGQAHNNLPTYHTLVPVIVAKYPGT